MKLQPREVTIHRETGDSIRMPPLFAALAVDVYGEGSVTFNFALTTVPVLTLGHKTGQNKILLVSLFIIIIIIISSGSSSMSIIIITA